MGVPSQRRLSRQEAAVRGSCSSTPRFHLPEDAARPPRSFLCSPTARDSQSAPVSWQCSRGGSLLPRQRGCVWGVPGMVAMAVARPRGCSAVCCAGWLWGAASQPVLPQLGPGGSGCPVFRNSYQAGGLELARQNRDTLESLGRGSSASAPLRSRGLQQRRCGPPSHRLLTAELSPAALLLIEQQTVQLCAE